MESFEYSLELRLKLLNCDHCQLDTSWNYPNITSPFSRIYLVKSGSGILMLNNQKIELLPGSLYLIPGYVTCSYSCDNFLEKYYLHFTNAFINGLNIYDISPVAISAIAEKRDYDLFDRLLAINPSLGLRVTDPEIYQKKNWVNKNPGYNSLSAYLESTGIIYSLFSRFFSHGEKNQEMIKYAFGNFKEVLMHIEQNISRDISIRELADLACLSNDHFTRLFKKIIGITPVKYLNLKRIEKAQLLLLTTNLSIKEIVEKTGFNSISFFNRTFKKTSGSTPYIYRKIQKEII